MVDIERVQEILVFPSNHLIVILAGAQSSNQKGARATASGVSNVVPAKHDATVVWGSLTEKSQTVYTLSFAVLGDQALKVRTGIGQTSSPIAMP